MKIRKRIGLWLCLAATALLCCAPVFATDAVNTSADCYLDVIFTPEGLKASGVEFNAYKIASVTSAGSYVTSGIYATDSITNLLSDPTSENLSLLATTVAGFIDADSSVTPTATAITDSTGTATFTKLSPGVYFVSGDIYHGSDAYYIPYDTVIRIPMPKEDGAWNYYPTAYVKYEKKTDTEPLTIKVLKVWSDSDTNYHTTDNVTIELYKNGTLYDSKVLNKSNSWTNTWTNLDASAKWTFKEKSVSGYTGTVTKQGEIYVITNTSTSTDSESNKLPQTGLLWWPVPLLGIAGVVCIYIGIRSKKRGSYAAK